MVWRCISAQGMGRLHVCEFTINAKSYRRLKLQALKHHMLSSRPCLFQGKLNHILHILQHYGSVVEESGAKQACLHFRAVTH